MHIVNTGQAQAWNGYEGEHWADHDDRYDAVNHGFNEALLAAVGEDDRVVDIGCGNGQLTRLAASRAASATGLDLSEPMLARARSRAADEGIDNVTFIRGDAQVYEFADGEFDVVLSRFGIMFFADPVAAFRNVARALRPGGRLRIAAMTTFVGTDLGTVLSSLTGLLPTMEMGHDQGPTSFANPENIEKVLAEAGFSDIDYEWTEADGHWGSDAADAAEFLAAWGPIRHHRELSEATHAAVVDVLTEALRPYATPEGVILRGTAWLVTARR